MSGSLYMLSVPMMLAGSAIAIPFLPFTADGSVSGHVARRRRTSRALLVAAVAVLALNLFNLTR